jgi:hypothetical protein
MCYQPLATLTPSGSESRVKGGVETRQTISRPVFTKTGNGRMMNLPSEKQNCRRQVKNTKGN